MAGGVASFTRARIETPNAQRRRTHDPPLSERFANLPPAPMHPTALATMASRLKLPEGKKLYALRKQTPEPVFGILKSISGSASSRVHPDACRRLDSAALRARAWRNP